LKIIDCNPAIVYRELDAHHDDDSGRGHSAIHDPHVWTSPFNAILLAEQIRDVLVKEAPEYRRFYEANFLALKTELTELDKHIKEELAAVNSPYILVSHSSWGYFTDRYGLVQISLETDGKERGPRGLGDLVDFAARHNIKTLFIQKQHQSSAARVFAGEIGAKLVEIDPLAEEYIANLKAVTRAFVEATR
jgi:zinc transport system substrate-binding protein